MKPSQVRGVLLSGLPRSCGLKTIAITRPSSTFADPASVCSLASLSSMLSSVPESSSPFSRSSRSRSPAAAASRASRRSRSSPGAGQPEDHAGERIQRQFEAAEQFGIDVKAVLIGPQHVGRQQPAVGQCHQRPAPRLAGAPRKPARPAEVVSAFHRRRRSKCRRRSRSSARPQTAFRRSARQAAARPTRSPLARERVANRLQIGNCKLQIANWERSERVRMA